MATRRLYKPRARSFWTLVRRLLLRKSQQRPPPARPASAEEEEEGEKSGLLLSGARSSLEELLMSADGASPEDDGAAVGPCAKKQHGQAVAAVEKVVLLPVGLHRPVTTTVRPEVAVGGGVATHRRFMFGGFRRRLLMRRPWRPMLVAIPE